MKTNNASFDEQHVLHWLKHYLPAQAPLKDFVHHNTLHAFEQLPFHDALRQASALFGYKVYLRLDEYRTRFREGEIHETVLNRLLREEFDPAEAESWKHAMLYDNYAGNLKARVGSVRDQWKEKVHIQLDKGVHPLLFRTVGSYLDQGFSSWKFPVSSRGFLASLRELDRKSYYRIFKNKRVRALLKSSTLSITRLLQLIVGDEKYFEHYLIDQQFAHPGWSGMVSRIEDQPESLLDRRKISLQEFILFELLLELDALYSRLGDHFRPLSSWLDGERTDLFAPTPETTFNRVCRLWQEAWEWSYYDQVLAGMQQSPAPTAAVKRPGFQAFFCIDDRECSFRRYLEQEDPQAVTYGTPGFFQIDAFFQPEHGRFFTKICPAPLNPQYLIREKESSVRHQTDRHFGLQQYGLPGGWVMSQTLGFVSAFRLLRNIFLPGESPAMVSSFRHMDPHGKLSVLSQGDQLRGLQIGYTHVEMANRIEKILRSTGLTDGFAPLIYFVGHGASSVNNTHYAGYDCGACSGRPGSVNARVAAQMANDPQVRSLLAERGLHIPENTRFVSALRDTTRDEIVWYDEEQLLPELKLLHKQHKISFEKALTANARERARRFVLMDIRQPAGKLHEQVKLRSLSLFEPRPELNHATNALCVVGKRDLTHNLFLDRRSFMNSYDATIDTDGNQLLSILQAATPVCGGINLEYYFSRVDNYKLGAGTKLPHNVMGLIGVANGMDGDLRPGLPSQMVEVHDPLRLLMVVEQHPDVLLNVIQRDAVMYNWYQKGWVQLVAITPGDRRCFRFRGDKFEAYTPQKTLLPVVGDLGSFVVSGSGNLPVSLLKTGGNP